MTRHNDFVYLRHMRDHAREAMELLGGTPREELAQSRVVQLALMQLLEIVGEAANRVSPETRKRLVGLPWRDMVNMRNRIIHGYDTVKVAILWDTVQDDLPDIVAALDEFLTDDLFPE